MRLPETLLAAIEEETAQVERRALARAASAISDLYRAGKPDRVMSDAAERAAYLLTRLPATFAANVSVQREMSARVRGPIHSVLDLGAGPGTAMWAAVEIFPDIERVTAVERDAQLIEAGKRLAARNEVLRNATWIRADIRDLPSIASHDLVVLSYSLGELPDRDAVICRTWKLASVALVVIEPGTPVGFDHILKARDLLTASHGQIAAPCPHHNACPMAAYNDWCHFSVRVDRTSAHRRLKGGELGYEDEKFSYVVASKEPVDQPEARIVRHPLKHSGHVKLTLCTPEGLKTPTITKSQKALYRATRKADWGDPWPPDPDETEGGPAS